MSLSWLLAGLPGLSAPLLCVPDLPWMSAASISLPKKVIGQGVPARHAASFHSSVCCLEQGKKQSFNSCMCLHPWLLSLHNTTSCVNSLSLIVPFCPSRCEFFTRWDTRLNFQQEWQILFFLPTKLCSSTHSTTKQTNPKPWEGPCLTLAEVPTNIFPIAIYLLQINHSNLYRLRKG